MGTKKKTTTKSTSSEVEKTVRYVVRGYSDEEAQKIGATLKVMADREGVEIEKLQAAAVVEEVRGDANHPLREWYDFDDVEAAAMKHWLSETSRLIRSVRYFYVELPKRKSPGEPVTYLVDTTKLRPVYGSPRRGVYVNVEQAERNKAIEYEQLVASQVRAVRNAVKLLSTTVSYRDSGPAARLVSKLQTALDTHERETSADLSAAAEE